MYVNDIQYNFLSETGVVNYKHCTVYMYKWIHSKMCTYVHMYTHVRMYILQKAY